MNEHPIAVRRLQLYFTQEGLAEEVDVDTRTVQRWEAGERKPQPWKRSKLAKVLRVTRQQLDSMIDWVPSGARTPDVTADWEVAPGTGEAFREQFPSEDRLEPGGHDQSLDDPELAPGPHRQPDPPEIDDMQRREALRMAGMVAAMLALHPATDRPADTDDADYAQFNAALWTIYASAASKSEVLPLVRSQLGVLTTELERGHGPAAMQRIAASASDLYQLKGEIHFDGDDYTLAADSYDLAARHAEAAGDFDLWACALTRHSFLSVYERRFASAAPMLELAAGLARRGHPGLSTRHWVAAVQAETFAGLGDLSSCQRALDKAEEVRGLAGALQNGGWLRFDGSRLPEQRGTCYATLGRHLLAEEELAKALRHKLSPRRRAGVHVDLAIIGADRRDRDQVMAHASTALADAVTTSSDYIRRKLGSLQRHLVPMLGDKQVQRLSGEIKALAPASNTR
ncbi:Helix-turn-helix [Lentzea fradiae]|uniref:Helix-turn-helix n=1 Tax=Lentzea fradiae TaxID=200378 RepID=A0A1G7Q4W9_9PSEU|nr:helix-turn-helix transcriptional regulator [Lentzea fradiae]SDF93534.1 Helix-turn-helix [Lentzea fradiae]